MLCLRAGYRPRAGVIPHFAAAATVKCAQLEHALNCAVGARAWWALGSGRSGQRRGAGDRPPGGAAFGAGRAIGCSGQTVAARADVRGDGAVGGEKALRVARTLEPPHPPLAFPRRLVGMLGAVIPPCVPPVRHAGEHVPLGRAVTRAFVRADDARDRPQPLAPRAEALPRGRHVAPGRHQDSEAVAVPVDGPPQLGGLPGAGAEGFIQRPRVAGARAPTAQRIGLGLTAFPAPLPDRLLNRSADETRMVSCVRHVVLT